MMILTKPIHLWTSYPNPKPINCYNFSSYFSIKYYVSNGMMLWSMCTKNACLDISAPFGTMDPRLERKWKVKQKLELMLICVWCLVLHRTQFHQNPWN